MAVSEKPAKWYWFGGRLPVYLAGFAVAAATDRMTPNGIADWLIEVLLVTIAALLGTVREMVLVAALATACSLLGLWTSPGGGGVPLWLEAVNRLASIGAIWVTVYFARRHRQAEDELKVLRGMLPICASCKRIRHGDDEWQSLESYITGHSEATFTHSLCPECFAKYYAEIDRT
jgi:hypothetical protein